MVLGNRSVALKRRLKIVELARRSGEVRVDDLSERFGVSSVTVRSDLAYLEEQGLLIRRAGKAVAIENFVSKETDNGEVVSGQAIGPMLRAASQLVEPDQAVLIGPGRLAIQVIPFLGGLPGLDLILTSLDAVSVAKQCLDCAVNVIAGRIGADGSTLTGTHALQSLKTELFDTFIFEARSVNADGGLVVASAEVMRLCTQACAQAKRRIALVVESSLRLDQSGDSIAVGTATYLVFPRAPDIGCQSRLSDAGFLSRHDEAGALVFRKP